MVDYFYFDNGIHQYLTRPHNDVEKKEIEKLIEAIGEKCGCNLFEDNPQGFKSVWAPGLYLERLHLGKRLFKEITTDFSPNYPNINSSDEDLSNWLINIKNESETRAKELIEKVDFNTSIQKQTPSYAGGPLLHDLLNKYTPNEIKDYLIDYLSAEALQQIIMLNKDNNFRINMFHSIIKGFFGEFFNDKLDLNITRLFLDYDSITKGVHSNKKLRLIDPNKDLADGEVIHIAFIGTKAEGPLYPVNVVTFDNPEVILNRIISFKTRASWALAHFNKLKYIKPGKVLCINPDSKNITVYDLNKIPYETWIWRKSSFRAVLRLIMMRIKEKFLH